MKHTSKVVKISLSLALMLFVLTMTPASSLFNILKPASAAPLTSMSVSPMSNTINEMDTYDFLFKTATTGTIKTIEINFPSSFNVANIRLIERDGIGSGTLSFSGSTIKYTVGGSDSIPAGTNIRLEIARIIATAEGSFTVSIKTLNSQAGTIDGPTTSGPFIIKSITGGDIADSSITSGDIQDNTISSSDVSPTFMIKKTLKDDDAGHTHNWNPNGVSRHFSIPDDDITGDDNSLLVSIMVQDPIGGTDPPVCSVRGTNTVTGFWHFNCDHAPIDGSKLDYIITKLPPNVATSTTSASSSLSPFDSLLDK